MGKVQSIDFCVFDEENNTCWSMIIGTRNLLPQMGSPRSSQPCYIWR